MLHNAHPYSICSANHYDLTNLVGAKKSKGHEINEFDKNKL